MLDLLLADAEDANLPIVGALAWAALVSNFIAACIVGLRRDIAVAALTPFGVICAFLAVLAIRGIRLAR